jgi:hypothetical protein
MLLDHSLHGGWWNEPFVVRPLRRSAHVSLNILRLASRDPSEKENFLAYPVRKNCILVS